MRVDQNFKRSINTTFQSECSDFVSRHTKNAELNKFSRLSKVFMEKNDVIRNTDENAWNDDIVNRVFGDEYFT